MSDLSDKSSASFKNSGYLSDMESWCSRIRVNHPLWFALVQEISSTGMNILQDARPSKTDNQQLLAVLLHARALQSFQACLLLAERGLISDARTLSRCVWEDAFCIGALCEKQQEYLGKFETKHQKHRHGVANAFLNKDNLRNGLSVESIEKLQKVVDETKDAKDSWKWDQVAHDAGMGALYDTHYRNLSSDAAHPTLESLTRHVETDIEGNITQMSWLPNETDLDDTLAVACAAYLCAAARTAELFHFSVIEEKIKEMTKGYVELSNAL